MVRHFVVFIGLLLVAGCAEQDTDVTGGIETTAVSFNQANAPIVEFRVPDMMCPESCAVTAREILESQPGVREVLVNFETKSATVAIDEEEFRVDAALEAFADRGFVHTEVKSDDEQAADVTEPASPSDAQPAG
jgi:copper chaperone CopZ